MISLMASTLIIKYNIPMPPIDNKVRNAALMHMISFNAPRGLEI